MDAARQPLGTAHNGMLVAGLQLALGRVWPKISRPVSISASRRLCQQHPLKSRCPLQCRRYWITNSAVHAHVSRSSGGV